jgi:hypothetical protein
MNGVLWLTGEQARFCLFDRHELQVGAGSCSDLSLPINPASFAVKLAQSVGPISSRFLGFLGRSGGCCLAPFGLSDGLNSFTRLLAIASSGFDLSAVQHVFALALEAR